MSDVQVFPPYGFVKLVKSIGDEVDIVNAARVSFHKEIQHLDVTDKELIRWLLRKHHGTPFEQGFNAFWHVRVPIFVMREWVRHRIGHSVNEESGRYVELRPHFYLPRVRDVRSQVGKPGAYTFEPVDEETALWWINHLHKHSAAGYQLYQEALERGIAKEMARTALSLNLYTEFRWTSNARSLMHFLALRNHDEAQFEIKEYAAAMEGLFAKELPIVHEAFVSNGRVAP